MTTFEDWLRRLALANRLVPDGRCPRIDRGLACTWRFTLAGDWTGAVVASSLRLAPDTAGATLEDFACTNEGYDAGTDKTTFLLALTKIETGALLADDDGDALVWLAWDVLFTPLAGTQQQLFGGAVPISGKVTNGS